jgi:hypothetical protein
MKIVLLTYTIYLSYVEKGMNGRGKGLLSPFSCSLPSFVLFLFLIIISDCAPLCLPLQLPQAGLTRAQCFPSSVRMTCTFRPGTSNIPPSQWLSWGYDSQACENRTAKAAAISSAFYCHLCAGSSQHTVEQCCWALDETYEAALEE